MAELVFPAGVPLGLGDLSFYGLAIALGNNVQPRKAATTSWFDWYSKELPKFSVIAPTKWTAAHDRWAFGLGVVFGSSVTQRLSAQRTPVRYLQLCGRRPGQHVAL